MSETKSLEVHVGYWCGHIHCTFVFTTRTKTRPLTPPVPPPCTVADEGTPPGSTTFSRGWWANSPTPRSPTTSLTQVRTYTRALGACTQWVIHVGAWVDLNSWTRANYVTTYKVYYCYYVIAMESQAFNFLQWTLVAPQPGNAALYNGK